MLKVATITLYMVDVVWNWFGELRGKHDMQNFNFHSAMMDVQQAMEVRMKIGSYTSSSSRLSLQEVPIVMILVVALLVAHFQ